MADLTIFHNPNCRSSQSAVDYVAELGLDAEIVLYLKTKPGATVLGPIIKVLEGPVADLVRKDARFEKLGLDPADYTTNTAVLELLVREPALLQRPLIVKDGRAVIGRPLSALKAWLAAD